MYKSVDIFKLTLLTKYFEETEAKKKKRTASARKVWKTQRFYKSVKSRKAEGKVGTAKGNQKDGIGDTNKRVYMRWEAYF